MTAATKVSITTIMNDMETLESRILKAVNNGARFINFFVGTASPTGFKTVEDYTEAVKARYKQVFDLIKRRNYLLMMRTLANAGVTDPATVVRNVRLVDDNYATLGTMTMAETLMREKSIVFEDQLLKKMEVDLRTVEKEVEEAVSTERLVLEQRLVTYMSADGKTPQGGKENIVAEITADVKAQYGVTWVDPLELRQLIETLKLHIAVFKNTIKTQKADHNAKTEIEIPKDLNTAAEGLYLTAIPAPKF